MGVVGGGVYLKGGGVPLQNVEDFPILSIK